VRWLDTLAGAFLALHGIPFLMRSSSGFDLISHIQRVGASAIMAVSPGLHDLWPVVFV
jgi:hypothetical protein